MIRYTNGRNILTVNSKFINQGLLAHLRHNNILYKIIVPDQILSDNISRETYENFRKLSQMRKENVPINTFTLPKITLVNDNPDFVMKNISMYSETFRKLKTWHAYLCMIILVKSLPSSLTCDMTTPRKYCVDISKAIADASNDIVFKQFANRVHEEMQILSTYFINTPQIVRYGMNLPVTPEHVIINNNYINFIVLFVLVIIILLIVYYVKYRKHETPE